jgi:predicted ester cyclase
LASLIGPHKEHWNERTEQGGRARLHRRVMIKGQGDVSKFDTYIQSDVILHNAYPASGSDINAWKDRVRMFSASFTDMHVAILDQIAEGDKVVTRTVWSGVHSGTFGGIPATGRSVAADEIQITRMRDGKVAERWSLLDVPSLLKQIGVDHLPTD